MSASHRSTVASPSGRTASAPTAPPPLPLFRQTLIDEHISEALTTAGHDPKLATEAVHIPIYRLQTEAAFIEKRCEPPRGLCSELSLIGAFGRTHFGRVDVGDAYLFTFEPEGVAIHDTVVARPRRAEALPPLQAQAMPMPRMGEAKRIAHGQRALRPTAGAGRNPPLRLNWSTLRGR